MRIAIIGSGISGLGGAYLLARAHEVTVFERDSRAGGHANTVAHGNLALDTGFLVHNTRNYPLLGRLFAELGVRTQSSEIYLAFCEAAFRTRALRDARMTLTRPFNEALA